MNLIKTPMFQVSSYQCYASDINLKEILKYLDKSQILESNRSGVGSFQSKFIINSFDNNAVQQLFEKYILPLSEKIILEEFKYTKKPRNFEYWYNINHKNSYNLYHNHAGALLSGVFYIKVPDNSGNIVFKRNDSELNELSRHTGYDTTLDSNSTFWLESKEGKLIFFPSYVSHYVEQNLSEDNRISVSFNIME